MEVKNIKLNWVELNFLQFKVLINLRNASKSEDPQPELTRVPNQAYCHRNPHNGGGRPGGAHSSNCEGSGKKSHGLQIRDWITH